MLARRIIARLDVKGPNLVKGIHLEGLRALGDPAQFASHYYAGGADELLYQDVVASLYERNGLLDLVARTAKEIFIPLTVGGGLRTVADVRAALRAGADKVAINTAAIDNPALVTECSSTFGSSTIVVAIEAMRQPDGNYLACTDNGRNLTSREVVGWAKEAVERGAGEILLTSVDREGTGKGMEVSLCREVADAVPVPVIAHGGVGKLADIVEVFRNTQASAVAIAGILHYGCFRELGSGPRVSAEEGNTRFLETGRKFSNVTPASIAEIKSALSDAGIVVRPVAGER